MVDLLKALAAFGVLIGVCALCEWIADNAPWVIWILIPVVLYVAFKATFGNHFEEDRKEEEP